MKTYLIHICEYWVEGNSPWYLNMPLIVVSPVTEIESYNGATNLDHQELELKTTGHWFVCSGLHNEKFGSSTSERLMMLSITSKANVL